MIKTSQIPTLLDLLKPSAGEIGHAYPNYNIIRNSNEDWTVEFDVSGFAKEDLDVVLRDNNILVSGAKTSDDIPSEKYVRCGFKPRSFSKKFQLAEYTVVKETSLKDGVLTILLKHEVPKEKKPQTIQIKTK